MTTRWKRTNSMVERIVVLDVRKIFFPSRREKMKDVIPKCVYRESSSLILPWLLDSINP